MPSTQIRQDVLSKATSVVVKLGTQLLTSSSGAIDLAFFTMIAEQVHQLRKRGIEVTVVSSGAIGAGCDEMGLTRRPADVAELQAIAAIGQRRLMTHFHEAFAPHHLKVAQVLVTRSDFEDRARFLNIRNCISHLHGLGCVPIINENDTVAIEELCFGDNDMLAAMVTNALRAEALILLTGVDGLLDGEGKRIDLVDDVAGAHAHARSEKSRLGTGGIQTKLEAARRVTDAGEVAVIANGRTENVLARLFDKEPLGTVFAPAPRKLLARKRWLGLTKRPSGQLTVDQGAVRALCEGGKSLLASGITHATGSFSPGAVITVQSPDGREIARGLTNYGSGDITRIMGRRSADFEAILGHKAYPEVIHRDNMVVNGVTNGS